ncbi:MAG: family 43 glycosylhydrolase [Bacteroidaceae bacterium]|nr:family 43 glycosylhydrolase [Bacteroidaceae bacterium]
MSLKRIYLLLVTVFAFIHEGYTQRYSSIRPGELWLDTSGKPIQAHGFQIFADDDGTFYWYGENKEFTKEGSNVWTWGIRAYRSTDFYNWEDLGLIIPPDTVNPLSPLHFSQTLDRPHILHNKKTGKWVCWIKSMDTDGFFVVLQADRFEGPYSYVKSFKPEGFGVGDFDLYVNQQSGQGYVWFERPHWEMICAELTDDYLGTNGKFSEHFVGIRPPFTREAPAHFLRNGQHYMFTSGTTGYVPNPSLVCTFQDYHAEYTNLGSPHVNDLYEDSFGSQITSVINIPGTDLYVALADRWLPNLWMTDVPKRTLVNKEKAYLNHQPFERDFRTPVVKDKTSVKRSKWDATDNARYVFLPIDFDESGKPSLKWRDEWTIEEMTMPRRCQVGPDGMKPQIMPVAAPFPMPEFKRPEFDSANTVLVKMNRNGLSTKNIQKAIDKISKNGGGRVIIPEGVWSTGRVQLKSGVELHLLEGAELHFSGKIADYLPVVLTRDEGIDVFSLGAFIYAYNAENIALTGKGHIVGPPTDCEIYQLNQRKALNIENIVNPDTPLSQRRYNGVDNDSVVFLPKSVAPIRCKNVLIEGLTIDNGLYWNIVPQYCDHVIIRGVTVNSFGHGRTDGIDIDSSRNVLVEYCSLDCQDDCYTMKSGRNEDGLKVGIPTENVVLRYNIALRGAGGIVCGTELAGGIRNVYMHDCVFDGTDQAFRFKTLRKRGGGIDNIIIERVWADVTGVACYCDMLGSVKWGGELAKRFPQRDITPLTPFFRNVRIDNVYISHCEKLFSLVGLPERPFLNFHIKNMKAEATQLGIIRDFDGLHLTNVNVVCDNNVLIEDGCKDATFENVWMNDCEYRKK